MQFAGVGTDYPVLNEIREMYKKQGKEPPKEMASTVFYNRGVLIAALHVEAIRNALKAKPDGKITGEDTKKGFEKISNFTLGGLVPPLKITPQDHEGGITTLLGANGAGKTTTLKAISGLLPSERGAITKGAIELGGRRIDHLPPYEVVKRGVAQVFEGRRVFEHLTTEENLIAGGHVQTDRTRLREGVERVYQYFPRLADRRHVQSGYLSGGEQQMLVIGRALMSSPRVMLLD